MAQLLLTLAERQLGALLLCDLNERNYNAFDAIFRAAVRQQACEIPVAGVVLDLTLNGNQPVQNSLRVVAKLLITETVCQVGDGPAAIGCPDVEQLRHLRRKPENPEVTVEKQGGDICSREKVLKVAGQLRQLFH